MHISLQKNNKILAFRVRAWLPHCFDNNDTLIFESSIKFPTFWIQNGYIGYIWLCMSSLSGLIPILLKKNIIHFQVKVIWTWWWSLWINMPFIPQQPTQLFPSHKHRHFRQTNNIINILHHLILLNHPLLSNVQKFTPAIIPTVITISQLHLVSNDIDYHMTLTQSTNVPNVIKFFNQR